MVHDLLCLQNLELQEDDAVRVWGQCEGDHVVGQEIRCGRVFEEHRDLWRRPLRREDPVCEFDAALYSMSVISSVVVSVVCWKWVGVGVLSSLG
jgi:hypothetical protein